MKELTKEELAILRRNLTNYKWRFTNLYYIKDAKGRRVLFNPRDEQWEILKAIYEDGNTALAILKARQLGFSTLLSLIALDMVLFNAGFTAGIVDQTKKDAEKKLSMVKFAFDNLPHDLRSEYAIVKKNDGELTIQVGKGAESTVYGGTNSRGGTHQLLWISEWGAIQHDDPRRSDEIADGALPSAKEGIKVVETTWKGGKTGRLYTEVVEPAQKIEDRYRQPSDWHIYFYGWHLDESYMLEGDVRQISPECNKYLDELESKHGIDLVPAQKLWYFKEAWNKKNKRYEEFPSVLSEIFLSPQDGAIYAEYADDARIQGRVFNFTKAKEPFYVYWDIGKNDLMSLLFHQRVTGKEMFFDCYLNRQETLAHYAKYCQQWERDNECIIAGHYLPHDGGWERLGKHYNKSVADTLSACGLRNIKVVPRIPKLSIGIDYVREKFPSMVFHSKNLNRVFEFGKTKISFMDALENYRYAPLEKGKLNREPVHDIYSHPCDALRVFAEADERGMIPNHAGFAEAEANAGDDTQVITGIDDF